MVERTQKSPNIVWERKALLYAFPLILDSRSLGDLDKYYKPAKLAPGEILFILLQVHTVDLFSVLEREETVMTASSRNRHETNRYRK